MALNFHPNPGTFLICDFRGFIVPEMVKRRPVVVVSPRRRRGYGLCSVVPLSTTQPSTIMPYHVKIDLEEPLGGHWKSVEMWAKCDMIAVVSHQRLDLIRQGKSLEGKRIYNYTTISDDVLSKIREGVAASIGLTNAPNLSTS